MSLASRLPFRHAYAAGFPGLGSQAVPTDADALDYLDRMAAADGTSVEVGVATAVDAFFRGLKATPGLFDAIKASCILCGARTITGALVPLAGDAPTAQGGWSSGDYSRTAGMTGDGNALYLDSNRANNADPQNDKHIAVYQSNTTTGPSAFIGSLERSPELSVTQAFIETDAISGRVNSSLFVDAAWSGGDGLVGVNRLGSSLTTYADNAGTTQTAASNGHHSYNTFVFARNDFESVNEPGANSFTDATIAFYSIGTSLSLEALDTAVTNLITAIGEAL